MKHPRNCLWIVMLLAGLVAQADLPTLTKSTRLQPREHSPGGRLKGTPAAGVSRNPSVEDDRPRAGSAYLPLLGPAPLYWQTAPQPPVVAAAVAVTATETKNAMLSGDSPAETASGTTSGGPEPNDQPALPPSAGTDSSRLSADVRRLAPLRSFQGADSPPIPALEEFLRYFRQKPSSANDLGENPAQNGQSAPAQGTLRFVPALLWDTVPDSSATYRQVP